MTVYDITWNVVMTDPTMLILASLADGDKHGYAMMDDISRFAGVAMGPGTLYGAITRLEERGWIRPQRNRNTGAQNLPCGLGKLRRPRDRTAH